MKISKAIIPVAAATTSILGYLFIKGKSPALSTKMVADAVKTVSDVTQKAEGSFAGVPQSTIDEIVKNTYRGLKAVINGDNLEYWYKSSSGKTKNMARLIVDASGEIKTYLGNGPYFYANSPRFFTEKLIEAIDKVKNI